MVKKEMIAMLFDGGQGSRLGVLTAGTAKPALSFGGKYRIIDFALSNCINSGIDTVGVLTQNRSSQLNNHIGIGIPWDLDRSVGGVTVLPPYGENSGAGRYTGNANAVYRNLSYVASCNPDFVMILSGDQIYKMDYETMLDYHKKKNADITLAVMPVPGNRSERFETVVTDSDDRIIQFSEKPGRPMNNLVSMGICIFNRNVLQQALQALAAVPECDFEKNVLPYCLEHGNKLAAYEFNGYWKDVDTPCAYWEANMELIDIIPEFNLYEEFWRVYTKNDVIPPQYIAPEAVVSKALIGEGTEVYGQVIGSIIGNDVRVEEGAVVRDSVIMNGCRIGKGAVIEKAILAERVWVGEGTRIGTGAPVLNRMRPQIYSDGLSVIGEDCVIPAHITIGKNTAVTGKTVPEDYPGGVLAGGEILDKAGVVE